MNTPPPPDSEKNALGNHQLCEPQIELGKMMFAYAVTIKLCVSTACDLPAVPAANKTIGTSKGLKSYNEIYSVLNICT